MFSLPLVGSLTDAARTIVDRTVSTTVFVAGVPARIEALLDDAETLVRRIDEVVTGAAAAVDRAAQVVESTTVVVDSAAVAATRALQVVESAGRSADSATTLLDTYSPIALAAAPLAAQFVDELSPEEVHAATVLLDQLPELSDRMIGLMPVLATLETVGPELHELLDVAKDLRQAVLGVPGFGYLRRRGEEKENGG